MDISIAKTRELEDRSIENTHIEMERPKNQGMKTDKNINHDAGSRWRQPAAPPLVWGPGSRGSEEPETRGKAAASSGSTYYPKSPSSQEEGTERPLCKKGAGIP